MAAADIVIGAEDKQPVLQLGAMSNRHGLIAGATGTGKTVTLQVLAEGFSRMGVPVFAADVKGDLSGIAAPGKPNRETDRRLGLIPHEGYQQRGYPVAFWDVYGKSGHPVRTTVSEMGPLVLANLLELNDTQSGVLYAAFRIADEQGLLLLDLKDLKALLAWMVEQSAELRAAYGNITSASVGAIQRGLLVLEEQGADQLFGEPAVSLSDLMQTDFSGNGVVSLLDATQLVQTAPRVYAALLLWLMSELFEGLLGLRPASGTVEIQGRAVSLRNPREAARHGLTYLSEDRKGKGLHVDFGLAENLTLMDLARYARPLLQPGEERQALQQAVADYGIRTGSLSSRASSLSGGNQQKLALAKVLQPRPRVVVLDEPTRGVDVGAKRDIYFLIDRLAASGAAVVVISSELMELIGLCHRVAVMRAGRLQAVLPGAQLTEEALIAHATGTH